MPVLKDWPAARRAINAPLLANELGLLRAMAESLIRQAGPHRKWEVVRGGKPLGGGHATREAAELALSGFAGGKS
jgi:hypothetical protein